MKTAICFTGTCRSLQYTHENIKEYLIDSVEDSDIFMVIADNPSAYKAKEFFNIPSVKKIVIVPEPEYNINNLQFREEWPPPTTTKQIYYKMIKARQYCNEILSSYEKEQEEPYERIIFSRLDVKYFANVGDVLKNTNINNICIPDFHNTFGGVINGYNDRFASGTRDNMAVYFNLPDSATPFVNSGGRITAETLLKWHMEHHDIQIEKASVRFTRVRPDGKEIDLRLKNSVLKNSDT